MQSKVKFLTCLYYYHAKKILNYAVHKQIMLQKPIPKTIWMNDTFFDPLFDEDHYEFGSDFKESSDDC